MGNKWTKRFYAVLLAVLLSISPACAISVQAQESQRVDENAKEELLFSPSGVLMEAETQTVIFEKDKDSRRSPASITKIMTLILIFDAIEKGNLKMEDSVITSAYAKSMGGSQVFLEEGETQTVETMIKCIVIASGNDASVAMAEHIAGSESEFVKKMNQRAKELGMKNTNFEDCSGLTDSQNHYTTAYDVTLMSRELITRYPQILTYSSIWMEDITHVTRNGNSLFTLTNTNKLIRSYEGCVGLKTGSTSTAGFCLSAVAKRNGVTLISVVMGASDSRERLRDAAAMLNFGFASCSLYIDENPQPLPPVEVKRGKKDMAQVEYTGQFRYLSMDGSEIANVEKSLKMEGGKTAPVKKGDKAGELKYYLDGKEIGSVEIVYGENIEKADYAHCLKTVLGLL